MSVEFFLKIGTSVASVCGKSLVAGRRSAAERSMSLTELAGARGLGILPQRRLTRQLDQLAENIAERLQQRVDVELQRIPANEQAALVSFVSRTIEDTKFDDDTLFSADLSAETVFGLAFSTSRSLQDEFLLSEAADQLFAIVLREAVEHLTEVIVTLPSFQGRGIKDSCRISASLGSRSTCGSK